MNSVTGAALSGSQASMYRQAVSAHDIANVSTPGYSQVTPHQKETLPAGTAVSHLSHTPNDSVTLSNTDLATEMVELKSNEKTFKANLTVIKKQDEMIGDVIDLLA
jgi:flagellar basal body rod protein FlgG